eukprot:scaffold265023_cov35-Prasinocladus_malaysianus.AAC.1
MFAVHESESWLVVVIMAHEFSNSVGNAHSREANIIVATGDNNNRHKLSVQLTISLGLDWRR